MILHGVCISHANPVSQALPGFFLVFFPSLALLPAVLQTYAAKIGLDPLCPLLWYSSCDSKDYAIPPLPPCFPFGTFLARASVTSDTHSFI
jgi:hypothetical protein